MFSYLKDRTFLRAVALLVTAMVGVGIFGIPFAFAKAGFWVGSAWLAGLALVTIVYNLAFAELTLRTEGSHQIPGYATIWLGPWARRLSFFALILSGYGTLLAYIIIAGQFISTILGHFLSISPDTYGVIFAVVWSVLVLVRLRTVAAVDVAMMSLFGVTVLAIILFGLPHLAAANFQGSNPQYWFLPYGVIMFALSGANVIPLQRQLLAGRERLLKPAIIIAVVLVAVLYFIFAATVVGVSGDITSPEAISGLSGIMGSGIILLGSLFGVMTISTSFLMMGATLYETFHLDYRVKAFGAWLLVIAPPLIFFWSGLRNFIDVIGLIGSVAVGILTIVVLAAYLRAKKFSFRVPEFSLRLSAAVVWALIMVFSAGIVYAFIAS